MKMNGNFKHSGLILLSGIDAAGITEKLFNILAPFQIQIVDFEQVVIRDRLLLTVLINLDPAHQSAIEKDLFEAFENSELDIAIDFADPKAYSLSNSNLHVVALAKNITPLAISKIALIVGKFKGNIDRVRRTASNPITALEFDVTADVDDQELRELQRELARVSHETGIDVAVQRGGLIRRAKRVVLLDMDSTLIQEEVIDLLAAENGSGPEVAAITKRAMQGEIDFATSLRERTALLAGADQEIFKKVASEIHLTPGARTLISTLHRLGHKVGVVSGGFLNVIEPLLKELEVDFYRANLLEVKEGKLTVFNRGATGMQLMNMLASGIAQGSSQLSSAMNSATTPIASPQGATTAAAPNAIAPSVTININGAGDPSAVATEVDRRFSAMMARWQKQQARVAYS